MASIALYVTPERLSVPKMQHFRALEGKMKTILVVVSTNKGRIWKIPQVIFRVTDPILRCVITQVYVCVYRQKQIRMYIDSVLFYVTVRFNHKRRHRRGSRKQTLLYSLVLESGGTPSHAGPHGKAPAPHTGRSSRPKGGCWPQSLLVVLQEKPGRAK